MHDVLDPRDLVPDEAEQLAHSGYVVGDLEQAARYAAAQNDTQRLAAIADELGALTPEPAWPYIESSDTEELARLAESVPDLDVDAHALASRVHGAWLGRAVANTMGKPVEGLARREVEAYLRAAGQWPQTGYAALLDPLPAGVSHLHESAPFATAGNFQSIPRDDDLDWTVLGLSLMERYGTQLTTDHIAAEWLDALPFTQTFTAERAAYRNLILGLHPPVTASHNNPYREWIGALIRADIFGMVFPGQPGRAAKYAVIDARLSHVQNGIYGEMWAAALVAAALAADSPLVAFDIAMRVVPSTSRLFAALAAVRQLYTDNVTATEALNWVDDKLGHYNWVHTIINAALIAIGLLWGTSFVDAVAITISGGRDTDSSAATVGSVYGALHGRACIPERLVGTTHVRLTSSVRGFDQISISELSSRTLALAEAFRPERSVTNV